MLKTCLCFTVLSARHSNVVETHEMIHHVIGQCRNAACRCLQRLVVPKIGLCTEDSGEEVAAQDRSSVICGSAQRSPSGCEFTPQTWTPGIYPVRCKNALKNGS